MLPLYIGLYINCYKKNGFIFSLSLMTPRAAGGPFPGHRRPSKFRSRWTTPPSSGFPANSPVVQVDLLPHILHHRVSSASPVTLPLPSSTPGPSAAPPPSIPYLQDIQFSQEELLTYIRHRFGGKGEATPLC